MSTTRRAFIGVIRTKRALANAPGWSPSSESRRALVRLTLSNTHCLSLSLACRGQRRRLFRSSFTWPR